MITTIPERHPFAANAIDDFFCQDWPYKELVIVNTTGIIFKKRLRLFEIPARKAPPGDLFDFGVLQCHGEWIADWQDDCHYAREYLRIIGRYKAKDRCVSLRTYTGMCLGDAASFNVVDEEGSFKLYFRTAPRPNFCTWVDRPELVTRFYASKVYI